MFSWDSPWNCCSCHVELRGTKDAETRPILKVSGIPTHISLSLSTFSWNPRSTSLHVTQNDPLTEIRCHWCPTAVPETCTPAQNTPFLSLIVFHKHLDRDCGSVVLLRHRATKTCSHSLATTMMVWVSPSVFLKTTNHASGQHGHAWLVR